MTCGISPELEPSTGTPQLIASISTRPNCSFQFGVVREGKLFTPPLGASVLPGITRDSVLQLCKEMKLTVVETLVPRELLYIADEIFFTGTAAEITPVRSVDRIQIGEGHRGPITEKLQKMFFDCVSGRAQNHRDWNTPVAA